MLLRLMCSTVVKKPADAGVAALLQCAAPEYLCFLSAKNAEKLWHSHAWQLPGMPAAYIGA